MLVQSGTHSREYQTTISVNGLSNQEKPASKLSSNSKSNHLSPRDIVDITAKSESGNVTGVPPKIESFLSEMNKMSEAYAKLSEAFTKYGKSSTKLGKAEMTAAMSRMLQDEENIREKISAADPKAPELLSEKEAEKVRARAKELGVPTKYGNSDVTNVFDGKKYVFKANGTITMQDQFTYSTQGEKNSMLASFDKSIASILRDYGKFGVSSIEEADKRLASATRDHSNMQKQFNSFLEQSKPHIDIKT